MISPAWNQVFKPTSPREPFLFKLPYLISDYDTDQPSLLGDQIMGGLGGGSFMVPDCRKILLERSQFVGLERCRKKVGLRILASHFWSECSFPWNTVIGINTALVPWGFLLHSADADWISHIFLRFHSIQSGGIPCWPSLDTHFYTEMSCLYCLLT